MTDSDDDIPLMPPNKLVTVGPAQVDGPILKSFDSSSEDEDHAPPHPSIPASDCAENFPPLKHDLLGTPMDNADIAARALASEPIVT